MNHVEKRIVKDTSWAYVVVPDLPITGQEWHPQSAR